MAAALPPLQPVTPPTSQAALPTSPSNKGRPLTYAVWNGPDILDSLMDACAALFSSNYGVWGPKVPQRQRKRVKMTGARLRAQCVSKPSQTILVTCFQRNELVGHAFVTVWDTPVGK